MESPFLQDPDIGRLQVITERIDQVTYIQLMSCLRKSQIAWAVASSRGLGDWTWQEEPFLIEISSPRAIRKFNQILQGHNPRISISETRIKEPECDKDELLARVTNFLMQPCLPSFLRPVALRVDLPQISNEDPYKIAGIIFSAGLDERYIVDRLQPIP